MIKNYPKSEKKFHEFVAKLMQDWVKTMGGDTSQGLEMEDIKVMADTLIQSNPRVLYDFLDENHVYLQPHLIEQLNIERGWGYELSTVSGCGDEGRSFHTRKEAENEGFKAALKCLEELL